jgi:ribosomal protein L35
MSMKTNKSYQKRIKVSKKGKLLTRSKGQNHFNSKERRAAKASKGRNSEFHMSMKEKSRFLVNIQ